MEKMEKTLEVRSGDLESEQVSAATTVNVVHFLQHVSVLNVGPRKTVRYVTEGITAGGEANACCVHACVWQNLNSQGGIQMPLHFDAVI